MKKLFLFAILAGVAGCNTIEINAAKPYEKRYGSLNDAVQALQAADELKTGESVWILSNTTLKNLLKTTNGK